MSCRFDQTIVLVHIGTLEKKRVQILDATQSMKLFIKWGGLAGVYCFDLRKDRLQKAERSRNVLMWRAENIEAAILEWRRIIYPTTHAQSDPVPLAKIIKGQMEDMAIVIKHLREGNGGNDAA